MWEEIKIKIVSLNCSRRISVVSTLSLVLFLFFISTVNGEVDETKITIEVVDGDTFYTSSFESVRLANIDAPESNEPGYIEATNYLANLIEAKTVYLDIDDLYGTDPFDRLVCVVYIEFDDNHFMNVNQALVESGFVIIRDYYNEFSPYSWSLLTPRIESRLVHLLNF
jgi:micrococcal nuclease